MLEVIVSKHGWSGHQICVRRIRRKKEKKGKWERGRWWWWWLWWGKGKGRTPLNGDRGRGSLDGESLWELWGGRAIPFFQCYGLIGQCCHDQMNWAKVPSVSRTRRWNCEVNPNLDDFAGCFVISRLSSHKWVVTLTLTTKLHITPWHIEN